MAILKNNPLVQGFSGAIGNVIVFKQYKGKTIIASKGRNPCKQSELQRENRSKFRSATFYARNMMLDPQKKAYYLSKAKKLNLPNAYTAAITDYMRKGEIKDISTKKFTGKEGDVISLNIKKKDFTAKHVKVLLSDANGKVLEGGEAVRKDDRFHYNVKKMHDMSLPITVRVVVGVDSVLSVKEVVVGE